MQSPAPSLEELHHDNSLAGEAEGRRGGGHKPSRPTSTHQRPREHTATHDRPRNTRQRPQVGSIVAQLTALHVLENHGACSCAWNLPSSYLYLTRGCSLTTWCFTTGCSSVLPNCLLPYPLLALQDIASHLHEHLPRGHLPLYVMMACRSDCLCKPSICIRKMFEGTCHYV